MTTISAAIEEVPQGTRNVAATLPFARPSSEQTPQGTSNVAATLPFARPSSEQTPQGTSNVAATLPFARPSNDEAIQQAARPVLRRRRHAPPFDGVSRRLPAPLRNPPQPAARAQGCTAVLAIPADCALHRTARADRLPGPGVVPAAPRTLARGRLLWRVRRHHPRRRPPPRRPPLLPDLLHGRALEGRRPVRSLPVGLAAVPHPERRLFVLVSRARARGARAPLAGGHRPQARPDRRRGGPRPRRRRQGPRASRAGIQDRRSSRPPPGGAHRPPRGSDGLRAALCG